MSIRKIPLIFSLMWLWAMCGTSFGEEDNEYMARPINCYQNKNMSLSLRWDYHTYTDTDFFDFWALDSKESNTITPSGLGYELKLRKNMGMEIAMGYSKVEEDAINSLEDSDYVSLDMTNIYSLLSIKRYWPVSYSLRFFGGIGGDLYYIDGTIKYRTEGNSYQLDSSRTIYGGHALVGAEYCNIEKKYPISVDIQYKYTLLQIVDVDQDLVNAINTNIGSYYSSENMNLSGHTISLSLKIHF